MFFLLGYVVFKVLFLTFFLFLFQFDVEVRASLLWQTACGSDASLDIRHRARPAASAAGMIQVAAWQFSPAFLPEVLCRFTTPRRTSPKAAA